MDEVKTLVFSIHRILEVSFETVEWLPSSGTLKSTL